jgi:hypothetical protein
LHLRKCTSVTMLTSEKLISTPDREKTFLFKNRTIRKEIISSEKMKKAEKN